LAFVTDLLLAMDDAALLKFCGLNAANPAAPIGEGMTHEDIGWETVCSAHFGAEHKVKGGIESGGGRGALFDVSGVQAFALVLRAFLFNLPPSSAATASGHRLAAGERQV